MKKLCSSTVCTWSRHSRYAVVTRGAHGVRSEEFLNALWYNTCIEHLDLSWNTIGSRGASCIGWSLRFNSTLVTLDLTHNDIGLMPPITLGILGANARAYMCNRVGIVAGTVKLSLCTTVPGIHITQVHGHTCSCFVEAAVPCPCHVRAMSSSIPSSPIPIHDQLFTRARKLG